MLIGTRIKMKETHAGLLFNWNEGDYAMVVNIDAIDTPITYLIELDKNKKLFWVYETEFEVVKENVES